MLNRRELFQAAAAHAAVCLLPQVVTQTSCHGSSSLDSDTPMVGRIFIYLPNRPTIFSDVQIASLNYRQHIDKLETLGNDVTYRITGNSMAFKLVPQDDHTRLVSLLMHAFWDCHDAKIGVKVMETLCGMQAATMTISPDHRHFYFNRRYTQPHWVTPSNVDASGSPPPLMDIAHVG